MILTKIDYGIIISNEMIEQFRARGMSDLEEIKAFVITAFINAGKEKLDSFFKESSDELKDDFNSIWKFIELADASYKRRIENLETRISDIELLRLKS